MAVWWICSALDLQTGRPGLDKLLLDLLGAPQASLLGRQRQAEKRGQKTQRQGHVLTLPDQGVQQFECAHPVPAAQGIHQHEDRGDTGIRDQRRQFLDADPLARTPIKPQLLDLRGEAHRVGPQRLHQRVDALPVHAQAGSLDQLLRQVARLLDRIAGELDLRR